jgi:hypothetical protein
MSETQETPAVKPGETATQELGTEATPSAPETPEKAAGKDEGSDLATQLEAERKARAKAEMRANQLENKAKEEELARLKEAGNDKERADKLEAELNAIKEEKQAERERQAAIDFREKVISEFPEAVQKAAKKLIDKNPANLLWKDAEDWDDAGAQLREQLNDLKEVLGIDEDEEDEDEQPAPTRRRVNANNPVPNLNGKNPEDMSLEELRAALPKSQKDF